MPLRDAINERQGVKPETLHEAVEKRKKATEAHMKATAKWEKENYDKILVRFPIGTKEKIKQLGNNSVNGFINKAVLEALEKLEQERR